MRAADVDSAAGATAYTDGDIAAELDGPELPEVTACRVVACSLIPACFRRISTLDITCVRLSSACLCRICFFSLHC